MRADYLEVFDRLIEDLRSGNFKMELQRYTSEAQSCRVRFESEAFLGEVIIWEFGVVYQVVGSLENGDILFEKDGLTLEGKSYTEVFGELLRIAGISNS